MKLAELLPLKKNPFTLNLNPDLSESDTLGHPNKRAMMALGRSPEYHWNQII